jgi:hypothetical protein
MDTLPTDKLEAALSELEAEKQRRLQAKIEAGAVINLEIPLCVHGVDTEEDIEANTELIERAKAEELAKLQAEHGDCEIIPNFVLILLGVPSPPDFQTWSAAPDAADDDVWGDTRYHPHKAVPRFTGETTIQGGDGATDAGEAEESLDSPTPTYVRTTLRNAE